jgi:hypothetical protein
MSIRTILTHVSQIDTGRFQPYFEWVLTDKNPPNQTQLQQKQWAKNGSILGIVANLA